MTGPPTDPAERFSTRVDDYARHRPGYPAELVPWLRDHLGLADGAVVADVGAGTGLFTRALLDAGLTVRAVEPNAAMRSVAERELGGHERFTSVPGRAEDTGLPSASVDLVTAAQAFHWFDVDAARAELRRILRDPAPVALVWNARTTSTPFLRAYEDHLLEHGLGYADVHHRGLGPSDFERFFGHGDWAAPVFAYRQVLDLEGLCGRHYSSSYTPPPDHPGHAADRAALRALFEAHAADGRVTIEYETKVYCGALHAP